MHERFAGLLSRSPARLPRPQLLVVGLVVGFIVVLGLHLNPPDPEARLPGSQRLAALIDRQTRENDTDRAEVAQLQSQIAEKRNASVSTQAGLANQVSSLNSANIVAGTVAVEGTGFTVTLDDSSLSASPTGNVNDLVIHSQDVQAVVNGMWGAGAEAIAINGQRLVSTSAILCVGNTLLLNGAVFAPPYEISGIAPDKGFFSDDLLVRQLRADADRFSLRFSVGADKDLKLPAYSGPVAPKYAEPKPS